MYLVLALLKVASQLYIKQIYDDDDDNYVWC